MNVTSQYEMSREDVNRTEGAILLEFGAGWCEYCRVAQALIASALAIYPDIKHIKIEDGKGRALGRTFSVKLWPTLIFMKNGIEVKRLVRQFNHEEIESGLKLITN